MKTILLLFISCALSLFCHLDFVICHSGGLAYAQPPDEEVVAMVEDIHWLGHDSFRIEKENIVIYIDPWNIENPKPADLVFITHDHYDHCSPSDVKKLLKQDTIIVAPSDCAKKFKGDVRTLKPKEKLSLKGLDVEAVPAYNTNKPFHSKSDNWVGYIIKLGGVKIYHAGDTDFIPEMNGLNTDIALLPVSGTYVMTAGEAAKAAAAIKPKVAIPMHYGAIVGDESDARMLKELYKGEVRILNKEK